MNKDEEQEYRIWSSGKRPVSKSSDNRQDLGKKKGNTPKIVTRRLTEEELRELNDTPFVVKYEESLGPILVLWLFGGFVFLVIIIPGGSENAGLFVGSLLLHLFLFFFLGYYLIGKPINEYKEKTKLAIEANRKRKNANTRKRNLKQKNNDLEKAKSLVDEGGIDNLKKAIGIFEKYGK